MQSEDNQGSGHLRSTLTVRTAAIPAVRKLASAPSAASAIISNMFRLLGRESVRSRAPTLRLASAGRGGRNPSPSIRRRESVRRSGARWPSARSGRPRPPSPASDRKSTRLNSSHLVISYAVFCLKKKKKKRYKIQHRKTQISATDTESQST